MNVKISGDFNASSALLFSINFIHDTVNVYEN